MNQNLGSAVHNSDSRKGRWLPRIAVCLSAVLLLAGVTLGLLHRGHRTGSRPGTNSSTQATGSDQDALSISSAAKDVTADSKQETAAGKDHTQGNGDEADQHGGLLALQKQAAAQQAAVRQAAVQQAAQEAELAEKNRELEQRAAAQATNEQQLEQDRLRIELEKKKAEATAAEVEQLRQETFAKQAKAAVYSGPSSGSIVWQGEVRGTTLVTINGSGSDTGQVLSGALPGVLVMVQPVDTKHVGVAGAPAPSNSFRRLTLRVQGNGVLQEVIRWSIP